MIQCSGLEPRPEVNTAGIEPMQETIRAAGKEDELDQARAQEYALLARLLAHSPDAPMIERLAGLRGDATPLGLAHAALGQAAARAGPEQVDREYVELFAGLGQNGLLPYASHYRTGALYGRPLAQLREDLQRLGIERTAGESEPEDHAAILLEIMAGLAGGQIGAPPGTDRGFFEQHLAPWIGRFFADLAQVNSAEFYASVGAFGRIFIEIETEAFTLPA
jgi:TorA maturation chaperone TorD